MGRAHYIFMSLVLSACGAEAESPSTDLESGGEVVPSAETPDDANVAVAPVVIPVGPIEPLDPVEPEDDLVEEEEPEPEPSEVSEHLEGNLGALGTALAAAQGAQGATLCETAYNGAMAMMRALQQHSNHTPSNLPSKAQFVTGCAQLSTQAQQCLTMQYALANQAQCSAVMQSAEVQAFRNRMRPNP